MLSIPDGEMFEFEVVANNDPAMTKPAFIARVGLIRVSVWSDGTIQPVKTKFSGGLTTQTTLEKIWDEEL